MMNVSFMQASDGQCQCALGYRATQRGEACELKIYEICKDGQTRDQYGKCLDHKQWKHLCTHEVGTKSHLKSCKVPTYICGHEHTLFIA